MTILAKNFFLPKHLASYILSKFNTHILHYLDITLASKSTCQMKYPPVFIIGAPRSGSTLFYQAVIERYDLGYLTNLHCLFFGSPSLAEKLLFPAKWRQPMTFNSVHGVVSGLASPSECGAYWYRFFQRKPQYVSGKDADSHKMEELRLSLNMLSETFNKPFIFKNMNCALRLQPLSRVVPEAIFLVTHRDIVDNAISLLNVRERVFGSYKQWWSMEPPQVERLKKLPAHEQVVEQIVQINELIAENATIIGNHKFFHIQHEEFCSDVYGVLSKVERFLSSHGIQLKCRDAILPKKFTISKPDISTSIKEKIMDYAAQK